MGSVFLNHIGIAVNSTENLQRLFRVLGLETGHSEVVPEQGVETFFIALPTPAPSLELLKPVDPNGTVAKFIEKRGQGIHHLSFECPRGQLDPISERLRAAGYELIYAAPKPGAHSMRVNFIHPRTADGLLIEIMEPMRDRETPHDSKTGSPGGPDPRGSVVRTGATTALRDRSATNGNH